MSYENRDLEKFAISIIEISNRDLVSVRFLVLKVGIYSVSKSEVEFFDVDRIPPLPSLLFFIMGVQ